MKTTIELSDAALAEARRVAQREGTSLRALIEEGLRVLADRRARRAGSRLRDASFSGKGLSPEFAGESCPAMRDAIYCERGA